MMIIKQRVELTVLMLMLLVTGLSACTSPIKYQDLVVNYYMPRGWIKYDENVVRKRSGYQLITQAKLMDKGLSDVLAIHGKPDFVRAKSKTWLNLAYLTKGQVLSFKLNSGLAPNIYNYQHFNQLSQRMVKSFAEAKKLKSVK